MRKTTKGHGLTGAVLVTAAVVALSLLLAGGMLSQLFSWNAERFFSAILAVYALIFLAIAGGVTAALVQRWREVKDGEEDEARKY